MRARWYIKPVYNMIMSYIFDICISTEGNTVTVDYETMYRRLQHKLRLLGVTEKMFRYVWRMFLHDNSDAIVRRYRHRGKTVFRRDICDRVTAVTVVVQMARSVMDAEEQEERRRLIQEAVADMVRQLLGSADEGEGETDETRSQTGI